MLNPNLTNSKLEKFNQQNPSAFDDDQTIITSNRTSQLLSKIQVKYADNKENILLALNTTSENNSSNIAIPKK